MEWRSGESSSYYSFQDSTVVAVPFHTVEKMDRPRSPRKFEFHRLLFRFLGGSLLCVALRCSASPTLSSYRFIQTILCGKTSPSNKGQRGLLKRFSWSYDSCHLQPSGFSNVVVSYGLLKQRQLDTRLSLHFDHTSWENIFYILSKGLIGWWKGLSSICTYFFPIQYMQIGFQYSICRTTLWGGDQWIVSVSWKLLYCSFMKVSHFFTELSRMLNL